MTWHIPEEMSIAEDADAEVLWVLPLRTGRIHSLEPVARRIWLAADGAASLQEVVARLEGEFGWPPEETISPVQSFIAQLVTYGLLQEVPVP